MDDITVKKAVILAAGRGTRFLPITKVIPKEMMPIGNLPMIHYLLEECKASGIEEVGIVVREWGSLTEKYFEADHGLRDFLEQKGKNELLDKIKDPTLGLKISFIKQDESFPVGHGSPTLSAKSFVDNDDFAMMFADDLVVGEPGLLTLQSTWRAHKDLGAAMMSAPFAKEDYRLFSTIKYRRDEDRGLNIFEDYLEKPQSEDEVYSYENFIGRGIYSPKVIEVLEKNLESRRANDGEFSLWDAAQDLAQERPVAIVPINGRWLTTGNAEQMWSAQKAILEAKLD